MNTLDIFVLIVLGITLSLGLWKGLVGQVLSLVGTIIGYIAAVATYETLAQNFTGIDPNLAKIIAFMVIFFGCMLLAMLANFVLSKFLKAVKLSFLNHLGGAVLGCMKGGVVIVVVSLVLVALLPANHQLLKSSQTLPVTLQSIDIIKQTIPPELTKKYQEKLKVLQEQWRQKEKTINPTFSDAASVTEKPRPRAFQTHH